MSDVANTESHANSKHSYSVNFMKMKIPKYCRYSSGEFIKKNQSSRMESYISVDVLMAWKILYCELSLMLIALRSYCILLHDIFHITFIKSQEINPGMC